MSEKNSVGFETILKDKFHVGLEKKADYVIKNSKALERLYSKIFPVDLIPDGIPKPPQIDFDNLMVIAVVYGECPYNGYDIEIKSLNRTDDGLEVLVKETSPSKDAGLFCATTYPVHIISTERLFECEVEFVR